MDAETKRVHAEGKARRAARKREYERKRALHEAYAEEKRLDALHGRALREDRVRDLRRNK